MSKQLQKAVGYLHSIGIIHTDLKPENILMRKDGKFHKLRDKITGKKYHLPRNCNIKLIDFGNAVFEDEDDIMHISYKILAICI